MTAPACTCDTWGYCVACGPDRQAGHQTDHRLLAFAVAVTCGACDFRTAAHPVRDLTGLADELARHLAETHHYRPEEVPPWPV